MIDDFIQSEIDYFKPMLARQRAATNEMREKWRDETVGMRSERVSLETYDLCHGIVRYGPFEGLKLNRNTWWGKFDLGSQCLGLYEKEILNLIDKNHAYDTFIDIGAADGYYAVGMLHAGLARKAICFEISHEGQAAIYHNWVANESVGSLEIYGAANTASIANLTEEALENTLILIDIEGAEFSLVQGDFLSRIKNCEVIIEIHNWVDDFEKKYEKLLVELSKYFTIKPLDRVERNTVNIQELRSYTDDNRLLLISERRPCLMRFLYLTPLKNDRVV